MVNVKELKVGDNLHWFGEEFDGSWDIPCTVYEIGNEYALARGTSNERLLIDTDTAFMFKR